MNKIKINIGRERLSSEYIQSKQDFSSINNQVLSKTAMFKSTWFYGTAGLATVALCISFAFKNSKPPLNDSNATQKDIKIAQSSFANSSSKFQTISNPRSKINGSIEQDNRTIKEVLKVQIPKKAIIHVAKDDSEPLDNTSKIVPLTVASRESKTIVPIVSNSVKVLKQNFLPSINGKYNGEITLTELKEKSLKVSSGFDITEFEINFSTNRGDKTQKIEGDRVTQDVIDKIDQYGIDQMIFITSIYAKDLDGKIAMLTPMNLVVVLD